LFDFSGVIDTAETISTVSMLYEYFKQEKVGGRPDLMSTLSKKKFGGGPDPDLIFGFSGVIGTAESDFDDFRSEYLGEYEAICETVLAC
jgi:hypothetical protein